MTTGLLQALTGIIGESDNLIGGTFYTRLTALVPVGGTTFHVESTKDWATIGKFAVDGVVYHYTGKTNLTFTGITYVYGGTSVPGAYKIHSKNSPVLDLNRDRTALENVRRATLIDYAEGEDLNAIGRRLSVPRLPYLLTDDDFREVVKAIAYNPRGTLYGLELALDALVGAGNYTIYEDVIRYRGTVFIQIHSSIIIGIDPNGKTFLAGPKYQLPTGANTVSINHAIVSRGALHGIFWVPDELYTDCRLAYPSAQLAAEYPGATPSQAWRYYDGTEGVEVTILPAPASGIQFNGASGLVDPRYSRELRTNPEGNVNLELLVRILSGTAAETNPQTFAMIADGERIAGILFQRISASQFYVGLGYDSGIFGGTNLVTTNQYNVETNTVGFTKLRGALALVCSDTQAHQGTHSLRLGSILNHVDDGFALGNAGVAGPLDVTAPTNGTYYCRFWLYPEATFPLFSNAYMTFALYDPTHGIIGTYIDQVCPVNAWTQCDCIINGVTAGDKIRLVVYCNNDGIPPRAYFNNAYIYGDDFHIQATPPVNLFAFDPDNPPVTLDDDIWYSLELRKIGRSRWELWQDGKFLMASAYAASNATTYRQATIGQRSPASSLLNVKQLQLKTKDITDLSSLYGYTAFKGATAAQINIGTPLLIDADVGRGLAISGSTVVNPQGGNNNGRWVIVSKDSTSAATLTGKREIGAEVNTAYPLRVTIPGTGRKLKYPDDLGKTITLYGTHAANNGTWVISALLDPISFGNLAMSAIGAPPIPAETTVCEVIGSTFVSELGIDWKLDPVMIAETGLRFDLSGASKVIGTAITTRMDFPTVWDANFPKALGVIYSQILSGQLLLNRSIDNAEVSSPVFEYAPFYVDDPFGYLRIYLSDLVAAGVIPEIEILII